jgi:tetratricopeptide (TPR) repeat protein
MFQIHRRTLQDVPFPPSRTPGFSHFEFANENSSSDTDCISDGSKLYKSPLQVDQTHHERLVSLNDLAIRCALSGQLAESVLHFETSFFLLVEMEYTTSHQRLIDFMKKLRTAPDAEKDFFCERLDYDEGWNIASPLLTFDNWGPWTPWDELAASLLYNTGQVLLKQRRISVAKDAFVTAYTLARSLSTENSHLLMVPILHRIGYMQYWHRETEAAIGTLQLALKLCEGSPEQPPRTAATLNLLGVLFFHLCIVEKSRRFFIFALELQTKTAGPEDCAFATMLNNLGRLHVRTL